MSSFLGRESSRAEHVSTNSWAETQQLWVHASQDVTRKPFLFSRWLILRYKAFAFKLPTAMAEVVGLHNRGTNERNDF